MGSEHTSAPARRRLPRTHRSTIDRVAVSERLDAWAPLTLVHAPRGYGKTTAVTTWVRRRVSDDVRVLWVDVPPRQSGAAHWEAVARAWSPNLAGHPEPLTAWDTELSRHFGRVLLIIDGAENVVDRPAVHETLDLLRRHPNLHVVSCTRRLPASAVDLSQHVDWQHVSRADLAFDEGEARALFGSCGVDVSTETVRRLRDDLGGWPAMVHRAALLLAEETDHRPRATEADRVATAVARLRDHLARHFLPADLDEEELEFAVRASFVTHLVPEATRLLVEDGDRGPRLLYQLQVAGVVGPAEHHTAAPLEFPPLVRSALRTRDSGWSPEQNTTTQRQLIEIHIEREEWPQAFRQAGELGDIDLLVSLVESSWFQLAASQPDLLDRVLTLIPDETYLERPVAAAGRDAFRSWSSSTGLDRGVTPAPDQLVVAADDDLGGILIERLIAMVGARAAGHPLAAAASARTLLPLAERAVTEGQDAALAVAPAVFIQCAVTLQLVDAWPESMPVLVRAHEIGDHDPLGIATRNAEGSLGHQYALMGHMGAAAQWAEREATHPPFPGWMGRRLATSGHLARLWVALERLDPVAADEPRQALDAQRSDDELWASIVEAQTLHELLWGDPEGMLADVARIVRRRAAYAPPGTYAHLVGLCSRFDLRLALGHGTAAGALLAELPSEHPWAVVRRARLALLTDRPEDALVERLPRRRRAPRDRLQLSLIHAAAQLQLGDEDAARVALRRSLVLLDRTGVHTALAALPRQHVELLGKLSSDTEGVLLSALDRGLPSIYPAEVECVTLTEREQTVLDGLAAGLTVEAMAEQAFVSPHTIKSQRQSLYRKLDVRSRSEALIRAHDLGLRG